MKINKILAAGVAATLAVTSLSAVVSAEVQNKTFDVYQTYANQNVTLKINADVNREIADNLVQDDVQKLTFTGLSTFINKSYDGTGALTKAYNSDSVKRAVDYDLANGKGIRITATGYQEAASSATVTKTFTLKNTKDNGTGEWYLIVLDKNTPVYHDGEFASFFFHRITNLTFEIDLKTNTKDEKIYNEWANTKQVYDLDIGDIKIETRVLNAAGTAYEYVADLAGHGYTYGADSETNNANDKIKVLSEAASVDNVPLVTANTYLRGADVEKGKAITAATTIYQKLSATGVTTKALATNATGALTFTAVTPTNTTPIAINNKIYGGDYKAATDGYIYKSNAAGGTYYIWSPTEITPTNLAKVATGAATIAEMATNFATISTTGVLVEQDAADVVVAEEYTDYITASNGISNNQVASRPDTKALVLGANGKWINGAAANYLTAAKDTITVSKIGAGDSTAHLLAYAFANGGWYESENAYGDKLGKASTNDKVLYDCEYKPSNGVSTYKLNGWIPKTTYWANRWGGTPTYPTQKNLIERADMFLLSSTDPYQSSGQGYEPWGGDGQYGAVIDDNQSYNATFWEGTYPQGFAGLASQVADFFNKQDNGTITFTFAAASGATSGKWSDGVPSTEVGLKGFSSEYLNDFVLCFNYASTTGTMYSPVKLDKTSGTVTFDLADYLADCGGLTKATLHDIYYGLDNGIESGANSGLYGLWVSKVELAYDDAGKAAVDATTDDDTSDDAAVVVADDDDDTEVEDDDVVEDDDIFEDDDVIEDDDDDDDDVDADVIEDDDDDDTDVNNDVDYVDAGADDDANPGTGVGLAVIPAIVAAAAVVVSKKRK